jgi:hypothetical protein
MITDLNFQEKEWQSCDWYQSCAPNTETEFVRALPVRVNWELWGNDCWVKLQCVTCEPWTDTGIRERLHDMKAESILKKFWAESWIWHFLWGRFHGVSKCQITSVNFVNHPQKVDARSGDRPGEATTLSEMPPYKISCPIMWMRTLRMEWKYRFILYRYYKRKWISRTVGRWWERHENIQTSADHSASELLQTSATLTSFPLVPRKLEQLAKITDSHLWVSLMIKICSQNRLVVRPDCAWRWSQWDWSAFNRIGRHKLNKILRQKI